jgi:hypothetical protein
MLAVMLRPDLSETLAEQSRREDRPVADIVSDAVDLYLESQWRAKLDEELEAYVKLHPELMRTHYGLWVAIHEGAVVDQDQDHVTLYRRVRQRYGRVPVLVCEVTAEPIEEIRLRTPSTGRTA